MTFLEALKRAGSMPEVPILIKHQDGHIVRMWENGEVCIDPDDQIGAYGVFWMRLMDTDTGWSVESEVDLGDDDT